MKSIYTIYMSSPEGLTHIWFLCQARRRIAAALRVGDLSNASKAALDAGLHFEALLLSLAQQQLPEGTIVSSIVADYCHK
jgi:hypothetical protein